MRHLATGIPVAIAGVASAFFVVTANSWMNDPQGFTMVKCRVTDPQPLVAMFNKATPVETIHMILAAFMVTGFLVASVYAAGRLRGRSDRYHRVGLILPRPCTSRSRRLRSASSFAALRSPSAAP
jgi:cytochrome d ubiquinol oxidase subunit I